MRSPLTKRAPRIAVSACLLGEAVRYDGGDKHDANVCKALAARHELVSCCPETGAGLGVPRPPVHLAGDPAAPRAVGVDDPGLDVTGRLSAYIETLVAELDPVDGAVLKARSPSCGLAVPVQGDDGQPQPGMGLFARALAARWPRLPLADEADLADPARRDAFLSRVEAHYRGRIR